MNQTYRMWRVVAAILSIALLGGVLQYAYASGHAPVTTTSIAKTLALAPAPAAKTSSAPVVAVVVSRDGSVGRLEIPSIGVDARVLAEGLTPEGRMAVPNNFVD